MIPSYNLFAGALLIMFAEQRYCLLVRYKLLLPGWNKWIQSRRCFYKIVNAYAEVNLNRYSLKKITSSLSDHLNR